jgi:iron complex transport system substrate-binding protein
VKRLLLAFVLCLCCTGWARAAYDITDDSGYSTRFETAPARVISLLPSLTETLCALGACDRLVGVDRYSDWPPQVRALPQLGGGLDPSIEAVVALRPDVVFMGVSSRASARLRDLGLKVVTLEPHTLAGMRRVIRRLAATLQVHGATALIAKIDAGIAAAARLVPADVRGERVYFEVSPAPYAAGRDSFVGELLHEIGLTNIIGAGLGPFPKINPELVVRANPDLIMVSGESAAELARRPGWSHIRALQDGAVCVFNAAQRNILVRPGPRTPEAAQLMAECAAHPAAFR